MILEQYRCDITVMAWVLQRNSQMLGKGQVWLNPGGPVHNRGYSQHIHQALKTGAEVDAWAPYFFKDPQQQEIHRALVAHVKDDG